MNIESKRLRRELNEIIAQHNRSNRLIVIGNGILMTHRRLISQLAHVSLHQTGAVLSEKGQTQMILEASKTTRTKGMWSFGLSTERNCCYPQSSI